MKVRDARRWWALGAISLAVLAITLDVTVLNIALPTLAGVFKASEAQLQWFVTAYTLALVAGMLPAGLLGDRFGQKTVMVAALLLFAIGSFGCAYAPDVAVFIAARIAVALAGAAAIVVALSVLTLLFGEQERPRAVGIWGAANFLGLPLGPIVGGWILSHAWWGWIFLMNLPVAIVALIAVVVLVPASKAAKTPAFDLLGLVLASAGLVALMYGVIEAGSDGWGSAAALVPAVAGAATLVVFWLWENRVARLPGGQPLVDLSLFRSRSFTWGVILTAFGTLGLFGVLFGLPQYLQAIEGVGPEASGLRLLPVILGMIVGAVPADRVAASIGARLTVAGGFLIVVIGAALGSAMTVASGDAYVALWTFVVGIGAGLGFATAASAALVELPQESSGVASALLQALVKLGPALGSSVLGSVLSSTYQAQVHVAGLAPAAAQAVRASVFGGIAVARQMGSESLLVSIRTAFVAGMDHSVLVTAGIAGVAIALALTFLPGRKPLPAGIDEQAR